MEQHLPHFPHAGYAPPMTHLHHMPQPQMPAQLSSEEKYRSKYDHLKRKMDEMAAENEQMEMFLTKAQKKIENLKADRRLLYQKLEQVQTEKPVLQKVNPDKNDPISSESEKVPTNGKNSSTTKKKQKAPVDPNAPKRPANAFVVFCHLEREKIMKDREIKKREGTLTEEEMAGSNLTKELGQRWRTLGEEEKSYCRDIFKKDVGRYRQDLSAYKKKLAETGQGQAAESSQIGLVEHSNSADAIDLDHSAVPSEDLNASQAVSDILDGHDEEHNISALPSELLITDPVEQSISRAESILSSEA